MGNKNIERCQDSGGYSLVYSYQDQVSTVVRKAIFDWKFTVRYSDVFDSQFYYLVAQLIDSILTIDGFPTLYMSCVANHNIDKLLPEPECAKQHHPGQKCYLQGSFSLQLLLQPSANG